MALDKKPDMNQIRATWLSRLGMSGAVSAVSLEGSC